MMRIFLIGFMGAGKTTLGRKVAERMGMPFFDLDEHVERKTGKRIAEIFAEAGEESFRRLETEALAELVGREPNGIFATGGGTFTSEANRSLIQESGRSLWLDVDAARLLARSSAGASRPLFRGPDEALALLATRRGIYALADETLFLDGDSEDEDSRRLEAFLSQQIEIS